MRGRGLVVALVGAGAAALLLRRRSVSRGEHVDVYYDDGSMVSLDGRTAESERLLALASRALGGSAA